MSKPSCLDCKNVHKWSYPSTRDEPEDYGFECKLELDLDNDGCGDTAEAIASTCPKFEYFDWAKHEHDCDKAAIEQCLEDWKLLEEYNL